MDGLDIRVVQVDPSTFLRKRKRHTTACVRCHDRKVKCDTRGSPNGRPCKNCVAAGETCRSHVDGRTAGGSNTSRDVDSNAGGWADAAVAWPSPTRTTALPTPEEAHGGLYGYEPATSEEDSSHTTGSHVAVSLDGSERALPALSVSLPSTVEGGERLAPLDRFEAFVKDNLGVYAPSFGTQADAVQLPPYPGIGSGGGVAAGMADMSSDIGHVPPRLAVDMTTRPTLDLERQVASLDSADMEYLRAKGAFDLPRRELQQELIEAHFAEVHPTAPVLDRARFLSDFYGHRMPSRLLLFAVFTSGARACRNPELLDQKGTNHATAQRFYKATKAMLDVGYERDKLCRVQAQLLITWWWDRKDDGGRNMRACTADAINTAQSIGMHRWDHYPRSDAVLLGLWKRIWWTCFNRDVGVSVAHALPCILNLSSFDVPFATPEDFVEEPEVAAPLRRFPHSDVEVGFFIQTSKLLEALHDIHSNHFVRHRLCAPMAVSIAQREARAAAPPGVRTPMLEAEPADDYKDEGLALCNRWLRQLPETMRYDTEDIWSHKFWPAFLHIQFYTNVMLRFREKSVTRATTGRAAAERQYCQARAIAAATMVSKIMKNVKAHGQVLRCTGQLTNTLFNCLIFFLIEGQSLNAEIRRDAQQKYSLCLNALYDFSQLWISASLIHRLFETLQAHMHQPLPKQHASPFSVGGEGGGGAEWLSPLPGLRVSSDITTAYMQQLLATPFHYADTTTTGAGTDLPWLQEDWSRLGPGPASQQTWLDDVSPGMEQTAFPESLDAEQWADFLGLGGNDLV